MAADASLVGFGKTATNTVTTAAGAVSAGDTLVLIVSFDPGVTVSSTSTSGTGSDAFGAAKVSATGLGKIAAYVIENATGGGSVTATVNFSGSAFPSAHLLKCTGVATSSYDATSLGSASDATSPYTVTSGTFAQANNIVIAAVESNWGTNGAYNSSNFTIVSSESDVTNQWTSGVGKFYHTATTAVTPSFTRTNDVGGASRVIVLGFKEAAVGGSTGRSRLIGGKLVGGILVHA